jgi:hypothetical protein
MFAKEFECLFKLVQGVGVCPSGCDSCGISINALTIKTRVVSLLWSLQQLYGVENVVCKMCDHMTLFIDPKEGDVNIVVSIQILCGGAKGHLPADDKKSHVGNA